MWGVDPYTARSVATTGFSLCIDPGDHVACPPAELAARMGTSQSYIARLESGRVLPSMRTWQRLAAATGTRPKFTLEPLAGQ